MYYTPHLHSTLPGFRQSEVTPRINKHTHWYSVDRLGKLPSKEKQHTTLYSQLICSHVRFTHTIRPMRNAADPYDTTTEVSPINILPFKENY